MFPILGGGSSNPCQCHKQDGTFHVDEGNLTNKDTFPLKELQLGDTGSSNELLHFTMGPLMCIKSMIRLESFLLLL